ncbi:hypothetical protein Plhal710r2_c023g0095631 [Plasmopara halstedii]
MGERRGRAQEQQLEAASRAAVRAHLRPVLDICVEYGFRLAGPATEARDTIAQSLVFYVVEPPATTQVEFDKQKALSTCFLVPKK